MNAVSRQLQRIAAESKGSTKNRKKGLVEPLVEKTIAVNTAMSTPCIGTASRASSHQLRQVAAAIADGGRSIGEQQRVGLAGGALRLAAIEPHGEQEQDGKHHPAGRDDAAALIFEQALESRQPLQKSTPEEAPGQSSPNPSPGKTLQKARAAAAAWRSG